MTFDRSLLAHQQRQDWFTKHKNISATANVLVWVIRPDGKVHGSCVSALQLGPDKIHGGTHDGLLWWPQEV